jgi:acyl carrier protein
MLRAGRAGTEGRGEMNGADHLQLGEKVRRIVNGYLEAWKVPYSDLNDLDSLEREELLGVIQDELGIGLEPDDIVVLTTKSGLTVDDIVEALEEEGVVLY